MASWLQPAAAGVSGIFFMGRETRFSALRCRKLCCHDLKSG